MRKWLVRVLWILGIVVLIQIVHLELLGIREDLIGRGIRVAEAEARYRSELERAEERIDAALDGFAAELERVRCDIVDSIGSSLRNVASDGQDLERRFLERTHDLEGAVLRQASTQRQLLEQELGKLAVEGETVRRLARGLERDPGSMRRRMILPTTQLRGNGTVGSGVIVYSRPQPDAGSTEPTAHATFVLTAYHVVVEVLGDRLDSGDLDEVHVLLPDRPEETRAYSAKLVLFDRRRDLALLRLNTRDRLDQVATWLPRAGVSRIEVFRAAYAVGCPLGNRPLPTLGEVSSRSKLVGEQVFWMLSAPIYFGNSGGGIYLADSQELIGISSMIYTYGKANPVVVPHLGLFVPIDTIYDWLDAEGYGFVHSGEAIPPEMLWKLVYRDGATPVPAATRTGEAAPVLRTR